MKKKIPNEIRILLPLIREIKDQNLQEQVLQAWARAAKEGSFKNLKEIPFSVEIPTCSLFEHIQWVMEAALLISGLVERRMKISVNRDLLIASVLLHDLGKAFEYQKEKNQYSKSEIGKKFMHGFWGAHVALEQGVSQDLAHLISTHSKDSPIHAKLIEGVILHYADFAHADALRFQKGMELFLSK